MNKCDSCNIPEYLTEDKKREIDSIPTMKINTRWIVTVSSAVLTAIIFIYVSQFLPLMDQVSRDKAEILKSQNESEGKIIQKIHDLTLEIRLQTQRKRSNSYTIEEQKDHYIMKLKHLGVEVETIKDK